MIGKLEGSDFDKWLSQSEVAARNQAMEANDAFAAAMKNAIKRGREKATAGTFVESAPSPSARRIFASAAVSACGSPAAMCLTQGVPEIPGVMK